MSKERNGLIFRHIDRSQLATPPWYLVGDEVKAIEKICSGVGDYVGYNDVLYAIGNNHKGTYFPIVLSVIDPLIDLLESGPAEAKFVVLEVLIDLVESFEPEPGFETVVIDGRSFDVKELLVCRLVERRCVFDLVVGCGSEREGLAARRLLVCVEKWCRAMGGE